ncbi:MAG: 3-dehydroquinate synthase [Dehalococcoidales bacterium]|nr:3-dehydroquinate synthase [Dehalococcoidales bacterium]
MKEVRLKLGNSSYDIYIGAGLIVQIGQLLKKAGLDGKAVIITNPKVKSLYGDVIEQNLTGEGFKVIVLQIPEGEEQKSLEVAGSLYRELSTFYAERTTPIIALGGGVIGDLAGFVAATFLRGVPFIQIPTTLLAQVDSSIGGKVAVNYGRLKNKIGAFYQPRMVISDINILKTLTPEDLSDGLAEAIKYGVIWDKELFSFFESNIDRIKALDESLVEEVVFRSAKIKAEVVEKDERDFAIRNILNYGHTIGHGIEAVSEFKVQHGEAVAIGMIAAGKISHKMGILDKNELIRLESVIKQAGLPTKVPDLDAGKIIDAIKHDKKILKCKVRFILPKSIGSVFITEEVNLSLIREALID